VAGSLRKDIAYNAAKIRALEALTMGVSRWHSIPAWAHAARIAPTRRMYTYAIRLARYGLVERASANGRLVYQITPVGLERLAWLRSRNKDTTKQNSRI
jgi:hypothetical protein